MTIKINYDQYGLLLLAILLCKLRLAGMLKGVQKFFCNNNYYAHIDP